MATITAASLSRDDVNSALQSASAGDTIVLPAGTAAWTSSISWTAPANVTLKGAGTTATGGGDVTVITDNIASGSPLLSIAASSSGVFRLTGITFQSGTGSTKDNGTVTITGPATVRIDHCHINATSSANYKAILLGTAVFGVMDSCILDLTGTNAIYLTNGRLGVGDTQGNYEWTLPTNFGASDSFYVEECIINGAPAGTSYSSRVCDGWTSSRIVIRFNDCYQICLSDAHGTGHAGDDRGFRSQEVYCNKATTSAAALSSPQGPNYDAVHISSGTAVIWGNSWDQCYKNLYLFDVTRANNNTYNQNATPAGWGYAGTDFNGTGSNWDGGTLNGTDTVYGYPALDQPGRGPGDLLTGTFPSKVNSTTGTIRWPNQALEPIYLWKNEGSNVSGWGGNVYAIDNNRIVSDRDYYKPASGIQVSPTSPFNGTTGCGWGTLANRPTTCTTGVAYFAIDQGSWNKTASNSTGVQMNGLSGVLYIATATNTWTAAYTPYTYPHPLRDVPIVVNGGSGAGAAPSNKKNTVRLNAEQHRALYNPKPVDRNSQALNWAKSQGHVEKSFTPKRSSIKF